MEGKTNAIVLSTIKYNDRTNIVRIYTEQFGIVACAVPIGRTPAARERAAMLMPLSLVECVVRYRVGSDVAMLRELRRTESLYDIYADPAKNAIALFVSELLTRVIRQPERDEPLFRYIHDAVNLLEQLREGVANFHICFLYRLGAFLGISPNIDSFRPDYFFDMDGGVFTPYAVGANFLPPDDARVIYLLSRMTFQNMAHFRFTREQRNRVLDTIIAYYRLHHTAIGKLRSPEVLKQLFS